MECFLLKVARDAGSFSKHKNMFEHEEATGGSPYFHKTWKHLLGNQSNSAPAGMIHTWKRWREYIVEFPSQWKGTQILEALCRPSAGSLANYAGIRDCGGTTAARGVVNTLWITCASLGLAFPFAENGIQGYNRKMNLHVVKPKIPLERAQPIHFDYHARHSKTPLRALSLRFGLVLILRNDKRRTCADIAPGKGMQARMDTPLHSGKG